MTDSASQRTVFDPFLNKDVQVSDRLVDRLCGRYACGPTLPNGDPEFGWREFQTPPIQHEAAARITELGAERDELRVAIFGNDGYDPILRNGNFVEMATATELGRLGAIDRAIAAEFELTRVEGVTIERCAKAVCSGCASGVGFNDAGFHEFRLHTFPCHASAIRSLPPLAKRGDQKSRERSNPPAEQSTTLPQPLTEN